MGLTTGEQRTQRSIAPLLLLCAACTKRTPPLQCFPPPFPSPPPPQLCPLGKFSAALATKGACTDCAIGRYANTRGVGALFNCTVCPENTFGNATGLATCTPCPPLQSAVPGSSTCVCAPGTQLLQSGVCSECAPGTFQSSAGQTTCDDCPEGSYSPSKGAAACLPCPLGKYRSSGMDPTACVECDPGSVAGKLGTKSCIPCTCKRCVHRHCWARADVAANNVRCARWRLPPPSYRRFGWDV